MPIEEKKCNEFMDDDSNNQDDKAYLPRMTVEEYIKFKANQLET